MFTLNTLAVGSTILSDIGYLTIIEDGFTGGEGHGYRARSASGEDLFVKIFYCFDDLAARPAHLTPSLYTKTISDRAAVMASMKLQNLNPHYAAPIGLITQPGLLGIVCKYFNGGVTFEEWLEAGGDYAPRVVFIRYLAEALKLLHSAGVAHGDLNAKNILLDPNNPARWAMIDFSNAYLPGAPEPLMLGQANTMPVSFNDMLNLQRESIRAPTDVFAFAMLAHALLLGRWDFDGASSAEDAIIQRVKGLLSGDTVCGGPDDSQAGGLPFNILPVRMQHWFRRAYSPDASQRPTMADFCRIYDQEMENLLHQCGACAVPFFFSRGRSMNCPVCNMPLSALTASLPNGTAHEVRRNLLLGRQDLTPSGYSTNISSRHLVLTPLPAAAMLQVLGENGAFLFKADGSKRNLTKNDPETLIGPGDVLRVMDVNIHFN